MIDIISNNIFNRILNIGNTNQLELKSIYNKISLKTEVKSLGRVNIYRKYRRYKKSH